MAKLVDEDLDKLEAAGVQVTGGDARCVAYGHLTRLAIWSLRQRWRADVGVAQRIERVGNWLEEFGGWDSVNKYLGARMKTERRMGGILRERVVSYEGEDGEISF